MGIIEIIEEGRKCAVKIDEVDDTTLPTKSGMVFIFKDGLTNLIFEDISIDSNDDYIDSAESFVLQTYYDLAPIDTIFVNEVASIKNEIKKLKKGKKIYVKSSPYSHKIFSQIKDPEKLLVGYVLNEGRDIKKKEIIDFIWENEKTKPIMNRVFKSNDAIPSWSGFNFQGFVTILRVMQLINDTSDENMGLFEVEIEKYEDFVIYKNEIAEEIYQVKAYVADKDVSVYADALEKLLLHKEQLKNPKAKCYIATAADIGNWSTSKYNETIERYSYEELGYIQMDTLFLNIKTEISKFYESNKRSLESIDIELAFAYLCRLLATKITELHNKQQKTKFDYRIKLDEIKQSLLDTSLAIEENTNTMVKLRIYEETMKKMSLNIKSFCVECEYGHCDDCPINNLREAIEFVDIRKYAQIIDPEEIVDEGNVYISAAFSKNNIFEILKDLYHSDVETLYYDDKHVYLVNSDEIIEHMDRVIPSSISLKNHLSESKGLSNLLKIIENKTDIHSEINQGAITTTMNYPVVNYKQQKVTEISPGLLFSESSQDCKGKEKISVDFDFNLINRDLYRKGEGYEQK